ncbi:MAG: transporter, partial [Myxococcales bacterium]|nr:transporter [Myxococcales bacterium]
MTSRPRLLSRSRAAVAGLALGLIALGGQANAQSGTAQPGFYPEHFDPMPTQGMNLLNLGASQVLANLKPSFGVFLQYIDNPLELVTENDETVQSRIIKSQVRADVWLALGIADLLDVGLAVPFVLAQDGEDLAIFNRPDQTIDSFSLADIRLIPKIRIIDGEDAGGFGLALQATISFPTGSQEDFTSDGKIRVEPRLILDWTDYDSGFSIVANVGYHVRPKIEVHNLVIDDSLTWGVGVRIPTPAEALKVVASVYGAIPFDDNVDPLTGAATSDLRTTPIELAAALELTVGDFVGELGGGFGLTQGFGAPDFRLFLAAGYVPRCADPDGDNICSSDDQCPDEPEDLDGFEDGDGC